MAVAMKVIQKLALKHPKIGENLVPYYRQILPMFNLFKNSNLNIGDLIFYSQRKEINIGDLIDETLEILEKTGGDVNISRLTLLGCLHQHQIHDPNLRKLPPKLNTRAMIISTFNIFYNVISP